MLLSVLSCLCIVPATTITILAVGHAERLPAIDLVAVIEFLERGEVFQEAVVCPKSVSLCCVPFSAILEICEMEICENTPKWPEGLPELWNSFLELWNSFSQPKEQRICGLVFGRKISDASREHLIKWCLLNFQWKTSPLLLSRALCVAVRMQESELIRLCLGSEGAQPINHSKPLIIAVSLGKLATLETLLSFPLSQASIVRAFGFAVRRASLDAARLLLSNMDSIGRDSLLSLRALFMDANIELLLHLDSRLNIFKVFYLDCLKMSIRAKNVAILKRLLSESVIEEADCEILMMLLIECGDHSGQPLAKLINAKPLDVYKGVVSGVLCKVVARGDLERFEAFAKKILDASSMVSTTAICIGSFHYKGDLCEWISFWYNARTDCHLELLRNFIIAGKLEAIRFMYSEYSLLFIGVQEFYSLAAKYGQVKVLEYLEPGLKIEGFSEAIVAAAAGGATVAVQYLRFKKEISDPTTLRLALRKAIEGNFVECVDFLVTQTDPGTVYLQFSKYHLWKRTKEDILLTLLEASKTDENLIEALPAVSANGMTRVISKLLQLLAPSFKVAQETFEKARAALEKAQAALEEAQAALEEAKIAVEEAKTALEEAKTALEEAQKVLKVAQTALNSAIEFDCKEPVQILIHVFRELKLSLDYESLLKLAIGEKKYNSAFKLLELHCPVCEDALYLECKKKKPSIALIRKILETEFFQKILVEPRTLLIRVFCIGNLEVIKWLHEKKGLDFQHWITRDAFKAEVAPFIAPFKEADAYLREIYQMPRKKK